jgi:hypothetical protein
MIELSMYQCPDCHKAARFIKRLATKVQTNITPAGTVANILIECPEHGLKVLRVDGSGAV